MPQKVSDRVAVARITIIGPIVVAIVSLMTITISPVFVFIGLFILLAVG